MKALNLKQLGFFDPVIGLTLFVLFGITGVAVNSAHTGESEIELQTASVQTEQTIVENN
jgi:hypothetical protein